MKRSLSLTKNWILVLMLAASSFAQTEKTPTSNTTKIAVIDTTIFYDQEKGIREVIAAQEKLEAEVKPKKDELAVLEEKIKNLDKELDKFRVAVKGFPQGDYMSLEQTSEQYEKLIAEYRQKEEAAKIFYDKRKAEIFADIYKKVGDAIKQFAKAKGYAVIIDISAKSSFIYSDNDEVTEAFIRYYNENSVK